MLLHLIVPEDQFSLLADYDVNPRCLDDDLLEAATIERFDGANWEQNIGQIT